MSELVALSLEAPVGRITMTNGAARNSLSLGMIEEMIAAFQRAAEAPGLKAVILAAEGPVFCAGHDLKELRRHKQEDNDGGKAYFDQLFTRCGDLMSMIVTLPVPVIAQVQGIATAAGCQLVASCDLAYSVDEAKFATPGVNIGLFCSTPMVALSRNVSNKHAMEMLLTGEMITSTRAREIGLINDHVAADKLTETVERIAGLIASKARYPVKVGKEAYYRQAELTLSEAYAYTGQVMATNMMHEDAGEGIGAFLDKRHPEWKDTE